MPEDAEKYQYFSVGLLKDSFALESLKADAMKHHMIEQPEKLIALRLTEYYDLLARVTPPVQRMPHPPSRSLDVSSTLPAVQRPSAMVEHEDHKESLALDSSPKEVEDEPWQAEKPESEIVSASPTAELNAEAAAEYWATL